MTEPSPPIAGADPRGWRLAAAVTFVLALVATWPMPLRPTTALVGHPGNDVWNHIWGYWWVADELTHGRFPLYTDLQGWPGTHSLFFIDLFGAVWTLPVQELFGPVAAYNLSVFACFWSAGFAAWVLARHVLGTFYGRGDLSALVAAVAFELSPHLLAQAYNGITETLTAGGLPLSTLLLLRMIERPTLRRAVEGGLGVALCVTANWYYGLFSALAAGMLLAAGALARRERIAWRRVPFALGGLGLLAGLLVSPVLLGFSASLQGENAIVSRDPDFVWRSLIGHNMTDVEAVFHPGKFYSPDLKALHGEDLLIVVYVGWVLLALAALGLRRLHRWRDRVPWMLWIAGFGVLMLGPYLYVAGDYLTIADRRIPMPFLAFFDAFPIFSRISHPFRFVVPVQLALGILASIGIGALPRWGRAVAVAALVAEVLFGSPAVWPLPESSAAMPEFVELVKKDPVPGALIDLPITVQNLERAVYGYWQTETRRPSPYALNEPVPGLFDKNHLARAIRVAEGGRLDRLPPELPELDLVVAGRELARLGVRYVVFHGRLYSQHRGEQVLELLRVAFGPETATTDDGDHVWRLEPGAGATP